MILKYLIVFVVLVLSIFGLTELLTWIDLQLGYPKEWREWTSIMKLNHIIIIVVIYGVWYFLYSKFVAWLFLLD